MLARFFFILSLWAGPSAVSLSQSCIIYKKEKDGIYIGADTRQVSFTLNETSRRPESNNLSICKMDQVNNINFAVTGYAANIGVAEAKKVLQNTGAFADAIEVYIKSFGQKLADILETDRVSKSDLYKKKFLPGTVVGGSVFFFYDNGILNGRVVKIVLVSQPSQKATIQTKNELIDSIGVAGNIIATGKVLFNKDVWKRGAVNGINNIIRIEKIANPEELEGVADILFVSTKNEREWIQRKRCE